MSISKSNEHAWSPGTLWYSAETMLAMLRDLGRCLATTGAERLVLLNGHGGNTTLLATALRELRVEFGLKTFLVHPSVPPAYGGTAPAEELGMGIHGGLNETSVYLHLRPDQVDLAKAERKVPEAIADNEFVKFGGSVMFGWLSNDFDDEGYIGDPTGATAELGEQLFDANVAHLAAQMAEIKTFDFGR
jgi:creatinine amidohydrolase